MEDNSRAIEMLRQEFMELKTLMKHIQENQSELSKILMKRGVLTERQLNDVRALCVSKPRIQRKKKSLLRDVAREAEALDYP